MFDVCNFDMACLVSLDFVPWACEFVSRKGEPTPLVAVYVHARPHTALFWLTSHLCGFLNSKIYTCWARQMAVLTQCSCVYVCIIVFAFKWYQGTGKFCANEVMRAYVHSHSLAQKWEC